MASGACRNSVNDALVDRTMTRPVAQGSCIVGPRKEPLLVGWDDGDGEAEAEMQLS